MSAVAGNAGCLVPLVRTLAVIAVLLVPPAGSAAGGVVGSRFVADGSHPGVIRWSSFPGYPSDSAPLTAAGDSENLRGRSPRSGRSVQNAVSMLSAFGSRGMAVGRRDSIKYKSTRRLFERRRSRFLDGANLHITKQLVWTRMRLDRGLNVDDDLCVVASDFPDCMFHARGDLMRKIDP